MANRNPSRESDRSRRQFSRGDYERFSSENDSGYAAGSESLGDELTEPVYTPQGYNLRESELGGTGDEDARYAGHPYGYTEDRHYRGPSYRGRGPKGYVRSDDRIKEEVCDILLRDHQIDASEIEVEVQNGEVTFSGQVPDKRMKYRAEDLTEQLSGVQEVKNNLRVFRREMT
jgi:hypothetical protein